MFVEQVLDLLARRRPSSTGLVGRLRPIAIKFGGRPATRLCRRPRLTADRTRLLTTPAVPDPAPCGC
ncbi:hypothetical protein [Streptomyces sp. NBC_00696]|uniref:hypothetical protein n=1 Tax=Streptomyces sp. NBC_00696 TaxID=2903672 RepID=UPI002E3714F6|nr:hypothetical protein [Streptomyces sp. NBC_00696]